MDTPEWERNVSNVITLATKGYDVTQIALATKLSEVTVNNIINNRELKRVAKNVEKKIIKEVYKDKIPVLKDIVGLSLQALRESLMELGDPERRREVLSQAKDMSALAKLAADVNGLLRLELGESTHNIAAVTYNFQQTRHILQDLRKQDPVFDYPVLPDESDN